METILNDESINPVAFIIRESGNLSWNNKKIYIGDPSSIEPFSDNINLIPLSKKDLFDLFLAEKVEIIESFSSGIKITLKEIDIELGKIIAYDPASYSLDISYFTHKEAIIFKEVLMEYVKLLHADKINKVELKEERSIKFIFK